MAYYMAKVRNASNGHEIVCQVHGVVATIEDEDEACDFAAAHDTSHGYDGEDGEE